MGLKWIMSLGLMGATTLFAQERENKHPGRPANRQTKYFSNR